MTVTLGLVAFLMWQIDWSQFGYILIEYGLQLYLWLIPIVTLSWLVYVLRWRVLLMPLNLKPLFGELTIDALAGLFYGLFLPTGLAGDAVRAFRLGNRHQAMPKSFLSVLMDRLIALLGLLLLFGIILIDGAPLAWLDIQLSWLGWGVLTAFLVGSGLILTGSGRAWMEKVEGTLIARWPSNIVVQKTDRFWKLIQAYMDGKRYLFLGLALALVYQLLITSVYYVGGGLLGIEADFGLYVWVVVLVMVAQLLPITIAGLGVRESLFVFLLGQYGVSAATAATLSLVVFSITILFALLGGLLSLATIDNKPGNDYVTAGNSNNYRSRNDVSR